MPGPTTILHCGRLINGRTEGVEQNVRVVIIRNKIEAIEPDIPLRVKRAIEWQDVDLQKLTCLPGMIDTHTHVLLQGDIIVDYDEQLLKESAAYRALRASRAVRLALENGFTGLRDLETEGAGYTDVDVKKAINNGIIPGPRMQVATRSLNVTGAYALLGYNWELDMPHGVQVCDGAEGCRKAVREQISHGADWIKVYSDQRAWIEGTADASLVGNLVSHSRPTFTLEELKAIVDEAHRERRPVAAHASGLEGAHISVEAGVDSIEHGTYIADTDLKTMAARGIWYVPTPWLSQYRAEQTTQSLVARANLKIYEDTFRRARAAGVKIAYGTDAGAFEWTITPAVQFPLMVQFGMTPMEAIQSATSVAAQLMKWDNVGSIEPGKLADIIAVAGDPVADISVLQKVSFVMKDGVVVKK